MNILSTERHQVRSRYFGFRKELGAREVVVWGHSQGAGVAVHMVALESRPGLGLVLESPYNSLEDQIHLTLAWYLRVIVLNLVGLDQIDVQFLNSKWAAQVTTWPMLVLHAEDDHKIPVELSEKLLEEAKEGNITISRIWFSRDFGYRHNDIYMFPNLEDIVTKFLNGALDTSGETLRCTPENMDDFLLS